MSCAKFGSNARPTSPRSCVVSTLPGQFRFEFLQETAQRGLGTVVLKGRLNGLNGFGKPLVGTERLALRKCRLKRLLPLPGTLRSRRVAQ